MRTFLLLCLAVTSPLLAGCGPDHEATVNLAAPDLGGQVQARLSLSAGRALPRNKMGFGDDNCCARPAAAVDPQASAPHLGPWPGRVEKLTADVAPGIHHLGVFWTLWEPPGWGSQTTPFAECPPGYRQVPANPREQLDKGYKRFRCLREAGPAGIRASIADLDAQVRADQANGVQTSVMVFGAPVQYRHDACRGKLSGLMGGCVPYADASYDRLDDFEDMVNFLAERYSGRHPEAPGLSIEHFVVWNEVNNQGWFDTSPNSSVSHWLERYAQMMLRSFAALGRHTRGVMVYASLTGAWDGAVPAMTGAGAHAYANVSGRTVVDALWSRLGLTHDWSIALHTYGSGKSPLDMNGPEDITFAGQRQVAEYQLRRAVQLDPGLIGRAATDVPQAQLFNSEQGWQQSLGESAQARNICLGHYASQQLPTVVGSTHNMLMNGEEWLANPAHALVGCFVDRPARALTRIPNAGSLSSCFAKARQSGYRYAGLQFGGECYGGNTVGFERAPDSECNMACVDGHSCGGVWRNTLYSLSAWAHHGCYVDQPVRDLPVALSAGNGSIEECVRLARGLGYYYAGLQYGGECRAGVQAPRYGRVADSECAMPCTHSPHQRCGGVWRSSVYGVIDGPAGGETWGLLPIAAGRDLSGADRFETYQALAATRPDRWNVSDAHYCCTRHGVGCGSRPHSTLAPIDPDRGGGVLGWVQSPAQVNGRWVLDGWACAEGSNNPLYVWLQVQNADGQLQLVQGDLANRVSEPIIGTFCGAPGTQGGMLHRYRFDLEAVRAQGHQGKRITVLGIWAPHWRVGALNDSGRWLMP